MSANDDTFFDIHMHAFNLSHPYFYSFLKRYRLIPESLLGTAIMFVIIFGAIICAMFAVALGIVSWLTRLPLVVSIIISLVFIVLLLAAVLLLPPFRRFIEGRITGMRNKLTNMLSVFENDIGSFFLIMENCLREEENPLLKNQDLILGAETEHHVTYRRIVLTPLMMDFGYKGKKKNTGEPEYHYSRPSEKPIIEQVTDVFNAIKKYGRSISDDGLFKKFPYLKPPTRRVFEIYPFLGINTRNYELKEIEELLDKYFMKLDDAGKKYTGLREDLLANMGKFDGELDNIPSNFFAGVKVYPPLGFDPWPTGDAQEMKKVECLYSFCTEHQIPITSHGGGGGFVAIEDKNTLKNYTAISKWVRVLEKQEYASLKLNIAHFPAEYESQRLLAKAEYKEENQRLRAMISLITERDNVYTDFSCRAWNDEYYQSLREVLDSLPEAKREALTKRILFGSDFAVALGTIESYNKYVDIFSRTQHLTSEEKHFFCSINPQRFLFA